ncbi:MAG: MbnH family di-heme enzyme [Myxococcota bacterium]
MPSENSKLIVLLALLLPLVALGCAESTEPGVQDSWDWDLPEGVPAPKIPDDNPMNEAKVELGRHLFYDQRLSGNQTQSCASCHKQELAFTDGLPRSVGATGQAHPRSSMSLANVAYSTTLNWANPVTKDLAQQQLTPLFGEEPVELGLTSQQQMLERLRQSARYPAMFAAAFPEAQEAPLITLERTTKAIAAFERTLMSFDSPYDRYVYGGDADALTDSQKHGMELFFSERLECFHCHGGFNFADSVEHSGTVFEETRFHNNGLYNVDGSGFYPVGNRGIFDITGDVEDMGRFKAPTLRNIALTAPYMHDGSIETLDAVVDHYARGGRRVTEGDFAGDGRENPYKSELITGFQISEQEKRDLIAFLESLTDRGFVEAPAHANPFE